MRSETVTPARSKTILVTGASSGLGRAAAIHLGQHGYRVFAGVRTEASTTELCGVPPSRGELIPVTLDVTSAASIARAGQLIEHSCRDTGLWVVETYRERFIEFCDLTEHFAADRKTTTMDYAATVAAALAAKHPRTRYRVGVDSRLSALVRRVLPDRMTDTLMASGFRLSSTGGS